MSTTGHCQGKNCHAGTHDYLIAHSLECQEEGTYSYAGLERPDVLECEKLISDQWTALGGPAINQVGE